jgi:apolipoprotein N-acyltransferase
VFRPDAETLTYDKRHMVPGFESYFALGTAALTFERGSTRLGLAICKDMDFPELGRGYPGARIMLVPAWDFGVDRWLHSRMAMLRGVENGYTIVRSARDGLLTVSDRYGRVTAEATSGASAELYADAPLGAPGPTLYERIGDAFGWACWALFALLAAWSFLPRKSEEEGGANAD